MADKRKPFNDARVIKRKSFYSFSKQYPGTQDNGEYLIGESRTMKRRETVIRIAFIVFLVLLFAVSFIVTYTSLELSNKPVETPTAVTETTQEGMGTPSS